MNTRFILILLSLTFSGCTLLYSYSDNLPQRIERWVAEKKYNTALYTIDYITPLTKIIGLFIIKRSSLSNK